MDYYPYNNNGLMNNSFIGYYIDDYNVVLNSAVPTNNSVIFADLTHGKLYSKKLVNGIPMIQAYSIQPLYGKEEAVEKPISQDDINKAILNRLEKLEGLLNEKSSNAGNDAKSTES